MRSGHSLRGPLAAPSSVERSRGVTCSRPVLTVVSYAMRILQYHSMILFDFLSFVDFVAYLTLQLHSCSI